MVGYTAGDAAREREVEASAIKRPSPTSASAHSKELSRETHVAGTPAQARTRDYVIDQMKRWGLETDATDVGVKMMVVDVYKIPIGVSLAVIAGILGLSVAASLLWPVAERPKETLEPGKETG